MYRQTYRFRLSGIAPISFSRAIQSARDPKQETFEEHDKRTWREHLHVDRNGHIYIPAMALKNLLTDIAMYRSDRVPGKRMATFTKHFESAVIVAKNLTFDPPINASDVEVERLFLPSDCKRGGGSRVWKHYPVIPAGWIAEGEVEAFDPVISPEITKEYLEHAGLMIGLGRWRARRGGAYGRFEVLEFNTLKGRDLASEAEKTTAEAEDRRFEA